MKVLEGVVVSVKMAKTAIVKVENKERHRLYGRLVKRTKRYPVACARPVKTGDKVKIKETRPEIGRAHV